MEMTNRLLVQLSMPEPPSRLLPVACQIPRMIASPEGSAVTMSGSDKETMR